MSKRVIVQSQAPKKSYAPGAKGSVRVGLILKAGVKLGQAGSVATTISITGPKGFESKTLTVKAQNKSKQVHAVAFKTSKKMPKGMHTLKVVVRYQASKKGKALKYSEISFDLPVQIK